MSELQISDQLIESIHTALSSHDQRAEDPGIAVQYMAAIIGFMIGKQSLPTQEKKEFIDQLFAFTHHVLEDVDQGQEQAPPPPSQDAFGIWKPDGK
jgi:hypothetical protein